MDIQSIWNIALEEIQSQVSKPSFETWFQSTKPLSFEDNTFVLATPHAFAADWLVSRYGKLIEEVLRGISGNPGVKLKTVYPKEDEKPTHNESLKVNVWDRIENRLDQIEEKLDKLLELLNKNKEAE